MCQSVIYFHGNEINIKKTEREKKERLETTGLTEDTQGVDVQ